MSQVCQNQLLLSNRIPFCCTQSFCCTCLNFPVHLGSFNSNACFTSSVLPLGISSIFFLCLVPHGIQQLHEVFERPRVRICVGFFNYTSCSKLATQNNNITFTTLYMYFISKTWLLKELSLTLHLAGESMTTWHNSFFS